MKVGQYDSFAGRIISVTWSGTPPPRIDARRMRRKCQTLACSGRDASSILLSVRTKQKEIKNIIYIMKTGKFLLTAFASLALSTAAYAGDIKVSNWVAQTPVGGEAIYVNEIGTTGAPGDWFFTKIAQDETPTMAFSKENDYKLIRMSISKEDGVSYIYNHDETGNTDGTKQEVSITERVDGTCMILYSYIKGYKGPRPIWETVRRDVAFISQAQYEYHVAAQKAADLLNESEYTGSTYSQLVAAIETTGKDWSNQTAAIATLQEQYLADKEAVEKALDELPEYIALGTLTTDVIKSSETLTLPEGAVMTVNDNNFNVNGSTINFAPSYVNMNGHAQKYSALLTVNVDGLEGYIPVYGYNPMLSWNKTWLYNSTRVNFYEPGEKVIPFWAAGYQGLYEDPEFTVVYPENTPSQAIQAFDIKVTKVDEDGNFNLDNVKIAYEVKVKFKDDVEPGSYQIYGIKIMNNYGQYLTLDINASKTSIEITDVYGSSSVDGYGFSYKGGTAHLAVKYAGFEGANAGARLKIEADENSPFSAKFVKEQEYYDGQSYQLNGNGLIYLDVTCAPMSEEDLNEIVEGAIKIRLENSYSWGPQLETSDEITLTRSTKPVISYADDEEKHEITLGGEVFDTHIDFYADGFGSIYSKDDIKIFTDCDVFVVGKMISWNKEGNRATISLKYDPTHAGVEMKGILYIMYNDQMLTYDLIGLAVSQAKIDELHGISTGIENVEAEGAAKNGVMFNVAGQRVNGAAKGLVIKNGKKYIVK